MAVNGNIKTDVIVMNDVYDVNVAIPTSKPAIANPYLLTIYNENNLLTTLNTADVPMLTRVVASYNEGSQAKLPDNFYLELSPPESILPNIKSTDGNTTTFAIKSISIQFATGIYAAEGAVIPGGVKGTKKPAVK